MRYVTDQAIRRLEQTLRRGHIRPTTHALIVSVLSQRVLWVKRHQNSGRYRYRHFRTLTASTSRFGVGQMADSNCTPLGLHYVAAKHGHGYPVGTVFKSRQPIGYQWKGMKWTAIAHRILWLRGLEPGFNQGGRVDSFSRYIYIHGLGDEPTLGKPASCGCIHLSSSDLIPLFDAIPVGTLVWIITEPV